MASFNLGFKKQTDLTDDDSDVSSPQPGTVIDVSAASNHPGWKEPADVKSEKDFDSFKTDSDDNSVDSNSVQNDNAESEATSTKSEQDSPADNNDEDRSSTDLSAEVDEQVTKIEEEINDESIIDDESELSSESGNDLIDSAESGSADSQDSGKELLDEKKDNNEIDKASATDSSLNEPDEPDEPDVSMEGALGEVLDLMQITVKPEPHAGSAYAQ